MTSDYISYVAYDYMTSDDTCDMIFMTPDDIYDS